MINPKGPYRVGGLFLLISAALHILAFLVGGFTPDALVLIPIGIIYALAAVGLFRDWRWLAYVCFIVMLLGGIIALGSSLGTSPVPFWWWWLIVAADWAGAAALFAALWNPRPAKAS